MKSAAVLLLSVVAMAAAAPILSAIDSRLPILEAGEIIPNEYIVSFRKGVDIAMAKGLADSVQAKYFYNIDGNFVGMAGEWTDAVVESLRFRSDLIEVIERNGVARTSARQTNPPSWGLGALSSPSATNPGYYDYPNNAGAGVPIYIIDTGIRCTHNDFGNRCTWGARFGNGGEEDGNGHGTHCAGTAAGTSYGVAKSASLIAVGVLGPAGSGSTADVVSGIEFASDDCGNDQCVGSMSLGGGASTAIDNAVNAAADANFFMSVAAGNSNANAANYSPARAEGAYTVMASDSAARKASYSNYGAVCKIWAPGSSITSAWSTSDSATNTISGTSMACPHVSGAGALAFASAARGNTAVGTYITNHAVSGAITGVPAGTVNLFLQVDASF